MTERQTSTPELIQGGMGVGISDYKLARAVGIAGEKLGKHVLGVVSGVGLPILMVDRLQKENPETIEAIKSFPVPEIAERIRTLCQGKRKRPPKPQVLLEGREEMQRRMNELLMVSSYVEVTLAKQGHNGEIGINLLEKIQITTLPTLYGAILAGVDYVLMGAGVPDQPPEILDKLTNNERATYSVDVISPDGKPGRHGLSFDPKDYIPDDTLRENKRPEFFAIISSVVLAKYLATKVKGVNGFIVEGPTAGGHNAWPRLRELEDGEPKYGPKDIPDIQKIIDLGLPVIVAGDHAKRSEIKRMQRKGIAGVQLGTIFALCNESGMRQDIKKKVRKDAYNKRLIVKASPTASPTGFPLQVAEVEESVSNDKVYDKRDRNCGEGYLVELVKKPDENGREKLIFRCPAEPIGDYLKKGGKVEKTVDRKCICTGLAVTAGVERPGEPPIVTSGKSFGFLRDRQLMKGPQDSYSAKDAIIFMYSPRKVRITPLHRPLPIGRKVT